MSPSTAPPFCSLTRSARIVPLTRPQTVTSCATTLPSTCAPSLIRRSEARNSPSIRPKICAVPLHSTLPTIDMSEPMQEAAPDFDMSIVGNVECKRSEEHTSELQSPDHLVCRLLLEKKKNTQL